VRKPDVILLDEATSALDNENEAKVQRALDELARHGSALVIAHRLSTIKDADEIVCLEHGAVAERGTHAELMALGGVYAALVSKQLVEAQHEAKCAKPKDTIATIAAAAA